MKLGSMVDLRRRSRLGGLRGDARRPSTSRSRRSRRAPEDVATIDGMIKAYYDVVSGPAGQPRDWARDRTLYIKDLRFVDVDCDKDGKLEPRIVDHQQYVDSSDGTWRAGLLREGDPPRHGALRADRPRLEHLRVAADGDGPVIRARHQLDRALLGRQALVDRQRDLDRRDEGQPDPEGVPAGGK